MLCFIHIHIHIYSLELSEEAILEVYESKHFNSFFLTG